MQSRYRIPSVHRWLGLIFLCSLASSLWLGYVPFFQSLIEIDTVKRDQLQIDYHIQGRSMNWNQMKTAITTWQKEFWSVVTAPTTVSSDGRTRSRWISPPVAAMFPSTVRADYRQLVQQGIQQYEVGDFQGAIERWQKALTFYRKNHNSANAVIVLRKLALAYQQKGESEKARTYLDQALAYYARVQNLPQEGLLLTEGAQVYSSSGQPREAIALAHSALLIARTYKDLTLEAAALLSRGEAYRIEGDYKQAIADLQQSAFLAEQVNNSVYHVSALKNLGNAYISLARINYGRANSAQELGDFDKANLFKKQALSYDYQALEYFDKSINIARIRRDRLGEMRYLLNSIPPTNRTNQSNLSQAKLQQALALFESLSDPPSKVYAAIELATFVQSSPIDTISPLVQFPQKEAQEKSSGLIQCAVVPLQPDIELTLKLLNQAVLIAHRLQDFSALSFALGNLGHIYECRQEYQQALKLTQQAQSVAIQHLNAKDSLYLWEWQAGRIMKAQNRPVEAITAYERAVAALQKVRSDILIANPDLQLDLRDTIEPIYRELIELKLSLEDDSQNKSKNSNENLSYVLTTLDTLKVAELQNYLGKDSISTAVNQKRVDLVGANTAVFSSIILEDRTAIIVSLPSGQKRFTWINLDNKSLKQEINEFRIGLEKRSDIIYNPQQAIKLYNWIVRPFTNDLESSRITTLVFIQDGILRSVPMAALHDGEKFLVEKYAIATTPSLTLTDLQTVNRENLRALAAGLTKDAIVEGRTYEALTNVRQEISQVEAQIPASKQLLNEDFTRDRLQDELIHTVYPIIHIATHGEFGSVPEGTFLVTGNNEKLTIADLNNVIRSVAHGPETVELLTLTACDTASGDDLAALGLAGVALQAGVRSALASLWSINDAATVTLVTKFYEEWRNTGMGKAEALGAAQKSLIAVGKKYAHPYYWAPLILVGNWL